MITPHTKINVITTSSLFPVLVKTTLGRKLQHVRMYILCYNSTGVQIANYTLAGYSQKVPDYVMQHSMCQPIKSLSTKKSANPFCLF